MSQRLRVILFLLLLATLNNAAYAQDNPTAWPIVAIQGDSILLVDPNDPASAQPIYTVDTTAYRERTGFGGPTLLSLPFNAVSPTGRYAAFVQPDVAFASLPADVTLQRWPFVIGLIDLQTSEAQIIAPSDRDEAVTAMPMSLDLTSGPVWSWTGDRLYYIREIIDQYQTAQDGTLTQLAEHVVAYDVASGTYETVIEFVNPVTEPASAEDQNVTGVFPYDGGIIIQRYTDGASGERQWIFTIAADDGSVTDVPSGYDSILLAYNPVIVDGEVRLVTTDQRRGELLLIDPFTPGDTGEALSLSYYPAAYAAGAPEKSQRVAVFSFEGAIDGVFVQSPEAGFLGFPSDTVDEIYRFAIAPDGGRTVFQFVGGGLGIGDDPGALVGIDLRASYFAWAPLRFELLYSPG